VLSTQAGNARGEGEQAVLKIAASTIGMRATAAQQTLRRAGACAARGTPFSANLLAVDGAPCVRDKCVRTGKFQLAQPESVAIWSWPRSCRRLPSLAFVGSNQFKRTSPRSRVDPTFVLMNRTLGKARGPEQSGG
jgi:hypothetical protein